MSAEKRWHSLLWKTQQTCPALKTVQGRANKKVPVNFWGFLSSLSPSAKAICFDPLRFEWHYWNCTYREDPLLALCTEIQEKPREKNQWRVSWCLFKMLLAEDQKISSRSPQTRLTLPTQARRVKWWMYLRDCNSIFLQTGQ